MEKSEHAPEMSESEKELRKEFPRLEPRLYSQAVLLTKHDFMRADDLVQKTFERALRFIHTYKPGSHISAWLHRVLQNLYFSQLRAEKREQAHIAPGTQEDVEYHPDIDALSPEEATYASQRAQLVAELPSKLLEIVTLLSDGTSFEDIAKKMNISKQEAVKLGHEALRVLTEREGEKLTLKAHLFTPNETIFDHLSLDEIRGYLLQVSDEQREAFVACLLEGKSYVDFAAQIGQPIGTIKSRISRTTERIIKLSGIQLKEKLSAFERCQEAARREPKRFLNAGLKLGPQHVRIIQTLVQNPNTTFAELAHIMKLQKVTLTIYLNRIVNAVSPS